MLARKRVSFSAKAMAGGIFLGVALLAAQGCGGAAGGAPPPQSPSQTSVQSGYPSTEENSKYAQPPSAPGPYPTPPGTASGPQPTPNAQPFVPGPSDRLEAAQRQARLDLEQATRDLDASANDCAAACRALASMERATARLCELADQPEDRQRCDDAKRKVYASRDRVRQTCTSCPGGPSVERSAPIPSIRS